MILVRLLYVGLAVALLVWAVTRWRRVERAEGSDLVVPRRADVTGWGKLVLASLLLGVGGAGISAALVASQQWPDAQSQFVYMSRAYEAGFPIGGLVLDGRIDDTGWVILGANVTIWILVSAVLVGVVPRRLLDWTLAGSILVGGAGGLAFLATFAAPPNVRF